MIIAEYIIIIICFLISGINFAYWFEESDKMNKCFLLSATIVFLGAALIFNGLRDRDMKKEWSTDIKAVNYTVDTIVNVSKNDTTYILNFEEK